MHECLQIPEIAELICQQAFYSDDQDTRNGVLALAQTCHLLYGPAVNVIWHTIPSLKPLADCIDEDIWDDGENEDYNIIKPLRPDDLSRCRQLGKRIRTLGRDIPPYSYWDSDWDDGTPTFDLTRAQYRALQLATLGTTLLPNVDEVRMIEPDSRALTFIHLFTHDDLKALRITMSVDNRSKSFLRDFIGFLSGAAHRFPFLRRFELVMMDLIHGSAVVNTLESTTWNVAWKNLVRLDLHTDSSAQVFAHLHKYPSLKQVGIQISVLEAGTPPLYSHKQTPPLLPQLQKLSLDVPDLTFATNFLRNLSPEKRPLQAVQCWVTDLQRSSSDRWADFIQCLNEQCSTDTLDVLSIEDTAENPDPADILPHIIVSTNHLNALLSFRCLRTVRICTCGVLDVDDAFIGKLAMSLPRLQDLRVYGQHELNFPLKLTPISLVELAEHCIDLHTLWLQFDSGSLLTSKPGPRARFGWKLQELDVITSPINEPGRMAAFLADLFPSLTSLQWGHDEHSEDSARWAQVSDLLPIFVEARSDEVARFGASRPGHQQN